MNMFAFFTPGPIEIVIIGVVAVLLFGNRLPKVARSVGSSFIEFKKGLSDVTNELEDISEETNKIVKEKK